MASILQSGAESIGVVSHGGVTRAYVGGILGIDFGARRRLGQLDNTAVAHVGFGEHGPLLLDWNLTPHLEA